MKYTVATICLDKDGIYSLRWYGKHADQGGFSQRSGEMGFYSLESLLKAAKAHLPENEALWKEIIKERAKQTKNINKNNPN